MRWGSIKNREAIHRGGPERFIFRAVILRIALPSYAVVWVLDVLRAYWGGTLGWGQTVRDALVYIAVAFIVGGVVGYILWWRREREYERSIHSRAAPPAQHSGTAAR